MTARSRRLSRDRHHKKKFLEVKDNNDFLDISEEEAVIAKRMRNRDWRQR